MLMVSENIFSTKVLILSTPIFQLISILLPCLRVWSSGAKGDVIGCKYTLPEKVKIEVLILIGKEVHLKRWQSRMWLVVFRVAQEPVENKIMAQSLQPTMVLYRQCGSPVSCKDAPQLVLNALTLCIKVNCYIDSCSYIASPMTILNPAAGSYLGSISKSSLIKGREDDIHHKSDLLAVRM